MLAVLEINFAKLSYCTD